MFRVRILAVKCIKQVLRQRSTRMLMLISTSLVFSSLYLMWTFSKGYTLHYLTSASYDRLSFDVECAPYEGPRDTLLVHPACRPSKELSPGPGGNLSPTDILINVISTGNILGEGKNVETTTDNSHDFSLLLSNVMMNGFPLLGLDDFVGLSDYVNEKLGEAGRSSLLEYSGYKDRFANFLDVRTSELRITGHKCLAAAFLKHLFSHSTVLKSLNVKVYETMADALVTKPGDKVWAVLELNVNGAASSDDKTSKAKGGKLPQSKQLKCDHFISTDAAKGTSEWSLTVRMHPSAIPDTRNFKWSPLKSGASRVQSGQLLYFISGFLTLQLEVQNFLASSGKGGPFIKTEVFRGQRRNFPQPSSAAQDFASAIIDAESKLAVELAVSNVLNFDRPSLYAPIYHRAFPTHMYTQQTYWHSFGSMIAAVLVIFSSLPAAVTAGAFRREAEEGQLDVLSTLPGVRATHSAIAWMLCSLCWTFLSALCCWLFFHLVCRHSYSVLPAVCLLLCGAALAPLALIVGVFVRKADTLVVAVPTVVFVSLLPGLLYPDLAFDVQRSLWLELLLCLLPASGAALILREVCANEALQIAVTWSFTSAISRSPMWLYALVLLLDCVVYFAVAVGLIHFFQDLQGKGGGIAWELLVQVWLTVWHSIGAAVAWLRSRVYLIIGGQTPYSIIGDDGAADGVEFARSVRSRSRSRSQLSESGSMSTLFEQLVEEGVPDDTFITALNIDSLSKTYTTGSITVEVLSNVSAKLKQGCVTALLGSNGAGKTTLMRILCGLNLDYTGTVTLQDVNDAQPDIDETKRRIGWCPQEDALFDCLTIKEHLQLFADLLCPLGSPASGRVFASSGNIEVLESVYIPPTSSHPATASFFSPQDGDIHDAMSKLGLVEHADKAVSQLSGGMKRRLSLALALAGSPRVLLADEPSSGCDARTRELIRQRILSRKETCAVLISTHHVDDIEVIADTVWFLNERYLVFDGPIAELSNSWESEGDGEDEGSFAAPLSPILKFEESSASSPHTATTDRRSKAPPNSTLTLDPYLEFSTWDSTIKRLFLEHWSSEGEGLLHEIRLSPSSPKDSTTEDSQLTTWRVAFRHVSSLKQFLASLENKGVLNWSLASPSVFSSLVGLYDMRPSTLASEQQQPFPTFIVPQANLMNAGQGQSWNSAIFSFSRQVRAICKMRLSNILSSLLPFLATQIIIPFLVVLAVAIGCTDVSYPKVELSSRVIEGAGEILVSVAPQCEHDAANTTSVFEDNDDDEGDTDDRDMAKAGDRSDDEVDNGSKHLSQFSGYRALQLLLSPSGDIRDKAHTSLSWRGIKNSDHLFRSLYDEYYSHRRNRWGAFVVGDRLEKWIESNVRISQGSLHLDIFSVFDQIAALGERSCTPNAAASNATSTTLSTSTPSLSATRHPSSPQPRRPARPNAPTLKPLVSSPAPKSSAPSVGKANPPKFATLTAADEGRQKVLSLSNFCDATGKPAMRVSLERREKPGNHSASSSHSGQTELSIVIHSYQAMNANVTMLSNVTTDHAAPAFLKEIAPKIYASTLPMTTPAAATDASLFQARNTPQYRLYSYPLPETNFTNQVFIQRGYLGATMVVMYMLITTIVCVRFVCQQRKNGVKTQLHLAGLSPLAYWLGNFVADVAIVWLPLSSVGVAVFLGGSPIRDYFLAFPPFPACLYTVSCLAFSCAVVASSYCFSALSTDQLASQLTMLVSATSGGVFLKLYLDRHNSPPFTTASRFFQATSPVFAFSTSMFELFKAHAVDVSFTEGFSSNTTHMETCVDRIFRGAWAMLLQAAAYLALTVLIDVYAAQMHFYLARLRSQCFRWANANWEAVRKTARGFALTVWKWLDDDVCQPIALLCVGAAGAGADSGETELTHIVTSNVATYAERQKGPSEVESDASELVVDEPPSPPSPLLLKPSGSVQNFFDSFDGVEEGDDATRRIANLLEARSVSIEYPHKTSLALCDFTAVIRPRERIALMGMNGGGKTTLFRALALAQNVPCRGSLRVCGLDSVFDQWSLGPTGSIGYVPQDGGLMAFLSVKETIDLFETIRSSAGIAARRDVLDEAESESANTSFGIVPTTYLRFPVHALSGGNKKKLLVHVANAGSPRLLLLDECTTGVDPVSAERLVDHLSTLDPEQGLLFTSHRIDECVRVCSRAIMLSDGQKRFDGAMDAFDHLASVFYQVDLIRDPARARISLYSSPTSSSSALLQSIAHACHPGVIERVVEYSPCLFRLTLEKRTVPLVGMWEILQALVSKGELDRFAFRIMSSEEAIGSLISSTALMNLN